MTTQNFTPWPESNLSVRFSDCDMYGHLNNISYLKYFLDAREDHIAAHYGLSLAHFAKMGTGWVVSTNQIAYLRPALLNEQVTIRTAVIDISDMDLLVEMQMTDAPSPLGEGRGEVVKHSHLKSVMWSKFVHVSLKDGRRSALDPSLQDLFEKLRQGGYNAGEFDRRVADLKSAMGRTIQQPVA